MHWNASKTQHHKCKWTAPRLRSGAAALIARGARQRHLEVLVLEEVDAALALRVVGAQRARRVGAAQTPAGRARRGGLWRCATQDGSGLFLGLPALPNHPAPVLLTGSRGRTRASWLQHGRRSQQRLLRRRGARRGCRCCWPGRRWGRHQMNRPAWTATAALPPRCPQTESLRCWAAPVLARFRQAAPAHAHGPGYAISAWRQHRPPQPLVARAAALEGGEVPQRVAWRERKQVGCAEAQEGP